MNPYNYGLSLIPEFIDPRQEKELVESIPLEIRTSSALGRSIIRFGYDYAYPPQKVKDQIPEHIRKIASDYNAVTVNIYEPKEASDKNTGIDMHIDNPHFGDTIHILSLVGDCTMAFEPPEGEGRPARIVVPRRSLTTLHGDVRKTWKHGTTGTQRRISIVYRQFNQ